MILFKFYL